MYWFLFVCLFVCFWWFFLYVLTRKKPFHQASSEVNKAKFKWTALSRVYHANHHIICNGDFVVAALVVS